MLCRKLIGAWVLPPLQQLQPGMAGVFHRGRSKVAPYEGLTSFLWPTRAKACAMFSWPFGPLSAFVRLRPPMMGLSTEQAEAVKAAGDRTHTLRRRGHPNDVSRWIISLATRAADWITGQVLAVDGGLGLV
jgi:hypothetical protein